MSYARITLVVLRTAAEWTATTQILNTWEAGLEYDTGKIKRGNGIGLYSALSYISWGSGGGGGGGDMLAANNLSDVVSPSTSRTNLGATTVGSNLFTVTNPSAIRYIRINADNSVSLLDASTFLAAIGGSSAFITSITDTNSIDLTMTGSALSANILKQNTTTITLAIDASGLKADFASLNISQFTNNSGYLVSAGIVGATKTKITYGANGLVSAGSDATTADIAASTDKNYVTDANLTLLSNTSGRNTGDLAMINFTYNYSTMNSGSSAVNSEQFNNTNGTGISSIQQSGAGIYTLTFTTNICIVPYVLLDICGFQHFDGTDHWDYWWESTSANQITIHTIQNGSSAADYNWSVMSSTPQLISVTFPNYVIP